MYLSEEQRAKELLAILSSIVVQNLIDSGVKEKIFTISIGKRKEENCAIAIVESNPNEIKIKATIIEAANEPESPRNVPKGYH